MKISEDIQVFHENIVDLEARTRPSTPPKGREQGEKKDMKTMERIRRMDEECTKVTDCVGEGVEDQRYNEHCHQ